MKIAFDVDDTLIIPSVVTGNRDTPNYETIALYKWFSPQVFNYYQITASILWNT